MQTAELLKLTPMFTTPSSITKKPQTHFTINFPKIHMITSKPLPFHISSCSNKDNADTNSVLIKQAPAPVLKKDIPKFSILTGNKLQLHSAIDAIFLAVKRVFSSAIELVSPRETSSFVLENDLILLEYNGEEIVGVVQHVVHHLEMGLMETTLLCELGLKDFKVNCDNVFNLTLTNEEKEKMWLIYTSVECKEDDATKMVDEIKDILNAHDDLKPNPKMVEVDFMDPQRKIDVICHVACSKLKAPHFQRYMEIRKKLFSDIDKIRSKHGSKDDSVLGD
ncbi:hypothetical protein MKX03_033200 [Papaver bracteatum]|nr:hypothetical protein MKX03_033200 [Papaver bracteatum]